MFKNRAADDGVGFILSKSYYKLTEHNYKYEGWYSL